MSDEKEPEGLDLSLDALIQKNNQKRRKCFGCQLLLDDNDALIEHKKSCTGHQKSFRNISQRQQVGGMIPCFDCEAQGRKMFCNSMSELNEHKEIVHGKIYQKRKTEEEFKKDISVDYIWLEEGNPNESLEVQLATKSIVKISASGMVEISGRLEHSWDIFECLKMCLSPVGLNVSFNESISNVWSVKLKTGSWSQDLVDAVKVSAFVRRAWSGIKTTLKQLPNKITLPDKRSKIQKGGQFVVGGDTMTSNIAMNNSMIGAAGVSMNPMAMSMMQMAMMMQNPMMQMAMAQAAMGGLAPTTLMSSGGGMQPFPTNQGLVNPFLNQAQNIAPFNTGAYIPGRGGFMRGSGGSGDGRGRGGRGRGRF